MSSIPSNLTRVPNLLQSQFALAQINRTQLALFQVQNQISSGRAVSRYSDDSAKAATIAILNDRLAHADQYKQNLDQADSSLTVLDQALGDASDLVLDAKGIASDSAGTGSTASERAGLSQTVNSLLQSLYGIANRTSVAGHIFAGSTPGSPAIVPLLGGYRYAGQGSGLLTELGIGGQVPITIGGNNSIGETSARVMGDTDLNPGLTGATRLVDLAGARGQGIAPGQVQFSFNGGPVANIDLSGADSVQDVATRITNGLHDYEQANSVTILGPGGVSTNGGSISIDVVPGAPGPDPTLQFSDISNGTTAQDLGLTGTPSFAFSATNADGLDAQAKLTWQTPISALRGITGPLGSIKVNNVGQSRVLDLSSAQTLEDVKNQIEGTGLGIRVEINADGTGINILNETAAGRNQAMSIEEVTGNNLTATRLGIRTFSATTRLADFNDGRGVQIKDGGVDPVSGLPDPALDVDFSIKLGDPAGTQFNVDLRPQDITDVQTLIDRINSQAQAAGLVVPTDFQATISDGANGLVLRQNASFPGGLTVTAKNNSPAADQLGLLDGSYDATSGSLSATDRSKVRVNNLFTQLIDLRDSLANNDTAGITLAGGALEGSVDRLAQTRALVGGYAKRVTDGTKQLADQTLLDKSTRSNLQDTDFTDAATRLSLLNTQLQAGLQVTASSFSRSLLDYLG